MSLPATTLAASPPQAAFGDTIEILPKIFQDDTNLAVMRRRLDPSLAAGVAAQLEEARRLDWRWRGGVGDALAEDLLGHLPRPERAGPLVEDIALICEAMAYLFDTETIGVRLQRLEGAMCPRFHVDNLAVRLVSTYAGPGSEWLPESAVERAGLGAPRPDKPDPLRDAQSIRRLGCGDIALLKGEGWIGNEGRGLVHRSPQPAPGEPRLLLALDPG
ncbi:hypothetical protein HPA02_35160 [Bisbaumannia pacifica]|uniref:DUF1826 domain-containing protein n=1 Tax=Bisbaumannia pacifica TaxID=77098 RepID=A0A510XCW6_9GAMM|nr:DUF1826 domain-containing protein [Halomonas pacifica]GEK49233.1 hypothetical protein HPA02_35160 [Halomonas pacifica]